jgi:nitrite reductase/ring-hydroxylating ferredoxin subunit
MPASSEADSSEAVSGEVDSGVTEVCLGPLKDLPLGVIRTVEIAGLRIGVVRAASGVYAFGDRCPHQGGPICAGRIAGTMLPSGRDEYIYGYDGLVVQCPWHAYEFYVQSGESVGGVVPGRLPVYETEIRDGDVYCQPVRIRVEAERLP